MIQYGVTTDWFYELNHQLIWTIIVQLYREEKPIDLIVVRMELVKNHPTCPAAPQALVDAYAAAPSTLLLPHFLEEIRDCWVQRHCLRACVEGMQAVREGEVKGAEIATMLARRFQVIADGSVSKPQKTLTDYLNEALHRVNDRIKGNFGLSTGFHNIDRVSRGLLPGQLWILAGRPSMGKTSLAMAIAHSVVIACSRIGAGVVAVFSLEMDGVELAERMVASDGLVNLTKISGKEGKEILDQKSATASASLRRLSALSRYYFIEDTPTLTVDQIAARCRYVGRGGNLKLVIVDYLQLIDSELKGESRREAVDAISRALKKLAKQLKVPIIAISQLNRAFEKDGNRKPQLSDLRESGQIEQDADFVGILYEFHEEGKTPPKPGEPRKVHLRIVKQRNGPRDHDVELKWHPEFTRYEDYTDLH